MPAWWLNNSTKYYEIAGFDKFFILMAHNRLKLGLGKIPNVEPELKLKHFRSKLYAFHLHPFLPYLEIQVGVNFEILFASTPILSLETLYANIRNMKKSASKSRVKILKIHDSVFIENMCILLKKKIKQRG